MSLSRIRISAWILKDNNQWRKFTATTNWVWLFHIIWMLVWIFNFFFHGHDINSNNTIRIYSFWVIKQLILEILATVFIRETILHSKFFIELCDCWNWSLGNGLSWTGKPGVLQSMGVAKSWTQLSHWTEWP